ncbi:helix-turn-helix domain-containing protein [Bacillus atrophaeus]|uniref:helix-turn-helix domain-containing protein n=1 Tax=Bacillus atrophaeus TaxID=1452 RepID=UPI003D1DA595
MIKSNLKSLMNSLESEGKKISVRQLSNDIDHGFETVRKMYNDDMERFPRDLLDKLCNYFECSVDDLIKFEKK